MTVPGTADDNLPEQVRAILADYFEARRKEASPIGADFDSALDALQGFVLGGGKRLRPTFAWWGWRGAGGRPDSAEARTVLRAISALELVQAGALVHDDIMDASAVRRGSPTMHIAFAEQHRAEGMRGEPERFGASAALLLGDVALAWADDLFFGAGLPEGAVARALPAWQAMRSEMLAGQYIDVLCQARGDESPDAAMRVNRFKTAAYTVERPLHIGASLAGAGAELIAAYRNYGTEIGIAFQLRDDLLGMFGDPEVTGKPAGDDLREGKRTVLMALGIQLAERAGRRADLTLLRTSLGRPDLDTTTLDAVRTLLVEVGAVRAIEERIEELTHAGLGALRIAPVAEPAAARLAELALTATRRDR